MGEALVPGAGDAELVGAGFGGVAGDGMELDGGGFCSEELGREGGLCAGFDATLDPDLRGAVVLPIGEDADAAAGGKEFVEVVLEDVEGEVAVDHLGDLEGGDDVQRDAGDDANGAEVDGGGVEEVAVLAGEGVEGAVGGDELDGGDDGGEIAVFAAGAVGGGGAGADDGDVGERGEVVDGEATLVDIWGEGAVGDAGSDGDGVGGGVERDGVEVLEGDLGGGGVGDAVEGVGAADGADFGVGDDEVLELGGGLGFVIMGGGERCNCRPSWCGGLGRQLELGRRG